jgi:hypothetical protein
MHFVHEVFGKWDLCTECIRTVYQEVIRLPFLGFGENVAMAIEKALPQVETYMDSI